MRQFEYIAVLVSVIIGLGIVHLLTGAARFLTGRGERRPYWVHARFGVVLFATMSMFEYFNFSVLRLS